MIYTCRLGEEQGTIILAADSIHYCTVRGDDAYFLTTKVLKEFGENEKTYEV